MYDGWEVYIPGFDNSGEGRFETMEPEEGYWILMNEDAALVLTGYDISSTSIDLEEGWNLIGYPSLAINDVGTALSSIEGKYDYILEYDADTEQFVTPTEMRPGHGYWIHVTEDATLVIEDEGVCGYSPSLDSVSISPVCGGGSSTDCEEGEQIKIDVSYSGPSPSPAYIQVDAMSSDDLCDIQHQGGDMVGMDISCTSSPCTGYWTIPDIHPECVGKTLSATAAGIYKESISPINWLNWKSLSGSFTLSTCHLGSPGNEDYCSSTCKCSIGEGDCDSDSECVDGAVCVDDVGADYGFDETTDVCELPTDGCHGAPLGDQSYCSSSCKCSAGEGDCDSNDECESGLECVQDVGEYYGWDDNVDVCEPMGGGYENVNIQSSNYNQIVEIWIYLSREEISNINKPWLGWFYSYKYAKPMGEEVYSVTAPGIVFSWLEYAEMIPRLGEYIKKVAEKASRGNLAGRLTSRGCATYNVHKHGEYCNYFGMKFIYNFYYGSVTWSHLCL